MTKGSDFGPKILSLRKHLKHKFIEDVETIGYEDEKKQLLGLFERTVNAGESDSVLIVGPRGSGKSLLVATCLYELGDKIGNEETYTVVRLHGLIHTNDNLALKDIIRQLHVEELGDGIITGSFSDNLLFLLQSLKSGNRHDSKPIIFILDEFQLFCAHRNQTLLYNLFDIAQSAQAPICVVGITCRVDVTEMLEKRVKSRFSHRFIYIFPLNKYEDHLNRIKYYLTIDENPKYYKMLGKTLIIDWNSNINRVLSESKVTRLIKHQFEIDPSEKKLKTWIFSLVSKITESTPHLDTSKFEEVLENLSIDQKVDLLKDLSVLELCMIVAASHHNDIYDGEPFNFEMVVKQYLKFAAHNPSAVTNRAILYKAFERLRDLELIMPLSQGKNGKKEYQLYSLLITQKQMKEAVSGFQGIPTDVSQWANSSVNNL